MGEVVLTALTTKECIKIEKEKKRKREKREREYC